MAKKKIPMTLLCGYLGAGKTTLLNRVLTNQQGYKVAVVVNDIGEINVDASLIEKGANITDTTSIVPLTNGCICCTLKTDLVRQIERLIDTGRYDYILIEASGVCEPMPIAQAIETVSNGRLDNVVSIVDAARMVDEFSGGERLLKEDMQETDIESLLVQQIEFCSTLVINKKDLVSADEMKKIRAVVNKLQPHVKVIETSHGDVAVADILATERFDFETVFASAGWVAELEKRESAEDSGGEEHGAAHAHGGHDDDGEEHEAGHHEHGGHHEHRHEGEEEDEYGISSFIYYRRRPFNRVRLDEFAAKWPRNIIRSKGVMWFSDEDDMAYVLESSGRQISCGASGRWLASCPERERRRVLSEEPSLKADWDEKVGDRMIRMCVIGQNLNKEEICKAFDALLD